jgi:hypothetical protein
MITMELRNIKIFIFSGPLDKKYALKSRKYFFVKSTHDYKRKSEALLQ